VSKVDFDHYAGEYERLAASQTRLFDADSGYFARYKIELMQRVSGLDRGAILDFGCGIGRSMPHLRALFPHADIVGCDPSAESLAVARSECPDGAFAQPQDIEPAPRFDLIIASCVFHHIEPAKRMAALGYCLERLRPGGRLFVFEHNPYNPVTRHLVNTCPFDADAVLLTRAETVSLLKVAGLEPSAAAYCLFFPQMLAALRPLEAWLGWLPLGGQYFVAGRKS
jgi:trans-aconitate methyltransferase